MRAKSLHTTTNKCNILKLLSFMYKVSFAHKHAPVPNTVYVSTMYHLKDIFL